MPQFPANIDLSSLDGTTGFKLSGAAAIDRSGFSVASAGDVNGDGFDDVIVGAYRADPNGSYSGASYVVFGKASGFAANIDLSTLDGTTGFMLSGAAAYDDSGRSVASAGDVNGDGFADLIVGATGADPNGSYSGASYVVFGKVSGFAANIDLSTLDGTTGFKLSGAAAYDNSGVSVASAGDVNGDGFADLTVGATGADPNGSYSGASYVVFGKASGFAANIDLSTLDGTTGFKLSGAAAYDQSGFSVASAGDVNGDGFGDLIVGAGFADPHGGFSGASYVVFGQASGFSANVDLSSLDGTTGFKLSGAAAYDYSGFSVASAGDVNGDGFADLIVGALGADPHGDFSGASYVVFGQASGFSANVDLSSLDGTTGFKLSGAAAYDYSGLSLASAGDVNGDGFADLIVGALGADPHGGFSGASYVVFGQASGFSANIDLSSLDGTTGFKLSGAAAYDNSGRSVASAGDVNGDGFADLIVGATGADPHGSYSGASYVVFGKLPDTAVNRTGTNAAQTLAGGDFNDTLSGLGGDDALHGNGGDDTLDGGAGNDSMMGGAGGDNLIGGAGDDTYVVDDAGDVVTELFNEGTDTVQSSIAYTLGADVENLTLTGAAGIYGVGNSDGNVITGNGAANFLAGLAGNDTLDGGVGADGMIGGAGNDTYIVDNAGDFVAENANEGTDTVNAAVTYRLTANVENLALQGGADLQGYGNAEANTLTGNTGNNFLDGDAGADIMLGGLGNDAYFVDNASDQVIENVGEGNDTVFSTAHFRLSANVDNLILVGGADLQGYGNSLVNLLYGGSGNDILDGAGGADAMFGGAGNDAYIVDNAGDFVFENAGEGADTVYSTAHFRLAADLDYLVLQGSADLQGYGNSLSNVLFGNTGNNILNGEGGADAMFGGAGNDAYFVDNAGDLVTEAVGAGNDTVFASVDYALTANVDNLVLQDGALEGTGNSGVNAIFGNSGNNTLDGGGGADALIGGAGNDTFVFNAGQANGDAVVDFSTGDVLVFAGFATGTFMQIGATNQWQILSGLDAHTETITLANGAAVQDGDFVFV